MIQTGGGRAFPDQEGSGMTLRDYFAGQALAMGEGVWSKNPDQVAKNCYLIADAMLAEKKRVEGNG